MDSINPVILDPLRLETARTEVVTFSIEKGLASSRLPFMNRDLIWDAKILAYRLNSSSGTHEPGDVIESNFTRL